MEILKTNLGLRMSMPELLYTARQYKSRSGNSITVDALHFIDALACPACVDPAKVAVGELLTDEIYVAETYGDFIAKAHAQNHAPDKPFTLQDVAQMPSDYLGTRKKQSTSATRIGMRHGNAAYAEIGKAAQYRLLCEDGHFDVLGPLGLSLTEHADYGDALVLLLPDEHTSPEAYDNALATLLHLPEIETELHCIRDCTRSSIAHAVLAMGAGAVLNLSKLPEQYRTLCRLTEPLGGNLVALPRDKADLLAQKAGELGLCASYFGVVDHAGYLIVRNGKDMLLCLAVSYLKAICFIRSYSLRIETESHLYVTEDASFAQHSVMPMITTQEGAPARTNGSAETVLRSQDPLRTFGAVSSPMQQNPYHSALICAMDAYCTAVAAGCKPESISLHAHLRVKTDSTVPSPLSNALAALLGLYRFSMETLTEICTEAEIAPARQGLCVLASAPTDMLMPATICESSRIYLLHPLYGEHGMPDWQDFSRMVAYLRHRMTEGKIRSARALCGKTVQEGLKDMCADCCDAVCNSTHERKLSLRYPGAFLVEADTEIEGDLIAFCAPFSAQ